MAILICATDHQILFLRGLGLRLFFGKESDCSRFVSLLYKLRILVLVSV